MWVATDLKVVNRSDWKSEPSVVHILWLGSCNVVREVM